MLASDRSPRPAREPDAPARGSTPPDRDDPVTCQVCGARQRPGDPILCRACGEPILEVGWAP